MEKEEQLEHHPSLGKLLMPYLLAVLSVSTWTKTDRENRENPGNADKALDLHGLRHGFWVFYDRASLAMGKCEYLGGRSTPAAGRTEGVQRVS